MIPEGLITYSDADLERKARELFRRRPHIPLSVPIKIKRLVEHEVDVCLKFYNGLRATFGIEGAVGKGFMTRTRFVCVDATFLNRPWPEYSAVLAEEFSHIHLHPALVQMVNDIEDFIAIQGDPQWPRFERDAKSFSLAIRIPLELLIPLAETTYERLVDEHGFGDLSRIQKLLRHELATIFRVPPEDMQRRLAQSTCGINRRVAASVVIASLALQPSDGSAISTPLDQRSP